MSFWLPVVLFYLVFFLGLFLYRTRHKTAAYYDKLHKFYIIFFFVALVTYLIWGAMRNFI